ncbi:MAG: 50S ribosomal protein L3 [Conexivisphaerales archaeon]
MRHSPRAGSLQFWPIKKSRRPYHNFPNLESKEGLSHFAAYKVGMASALYVDTYKNSPTFKQEVVEPVTLLEAPPLRIIGIRLYKDNKSLTDIWANLDDSISRFIKRKTHIKGTRKLSDFEGKFDNLNIIVSTQPWIIKLKKTPEIFEIPVGGNLKEKVDFADANLGKEIHLKDVFKPGDFIDVAGVTKGKGFSGAVRRYGVRLFPRKAEKVRRRPGAFGTEGLSKTIYTIPQHGRLGFNSRVEYNKLVLGVLDEFNKVFIRYGRPNSTVLIVKGSVPGTTKRLLIIRKSIRQKSSLLEPPKIIKVE